MSIKKLFFPFFRPRHSFLLNKVWFRLLIVAYAVIIAFLLWKSWSMLSQVLWGWCYDGLYVYVEDGIDTLQEKAMECIAVRRSEFKTAVVSTLLSVTAIHYIIQLISFKVIVDFIALGNKQEPKTQ